MGDILMLKEVAARLRTPEPTLRYWRHIGTGPASFKIGRRVMYREEDVEAWLAAQVSQGAGAA